MTSITALSLFLLLLVWSSVSSLVTTVAADSLVVTFQDEGDGREEIENEHERLARRTLPELNHHRDGWIVVEFELFE